MERKMNGFEIDDDGERNKQGSKQNEERERESMS